MDLTVSIKIGLPLRRFLPYWAVFRNDLGQVLRSGLYRACGLVVLALSAGLLVHRSAIYNSAGIAQQASDLMGEILMLAIVVGSTVVIVLASGAIAGERETLADSILCRGVSRWQYFFGKWHARLFAIIGGLVLVALIVTGVSIILLPNDLNTNGVALALGTVAALLMVVATSGLALSALVDSAVLGIAILWILVYGIGAVLFYFQVGSFSLPELLRSLPDVLTGKVQPVAQIRLIAGFALAAGCIALLGGMAFSRRDL